MAPTPEVGPEAKMRWIKEQLKRMLGYDGEMWTAEHDETCFEFVATRKHDHLFAWLTDDGALTLEAGSGKETKAPKKKRMYYFLRGSSGDELSHGSLTNGADSATLLRVMSTVYAPQLIARKNWPESVKKDVMGQFHKFMACLTETAFEAKTVLYLPAHNIEDPAKMAEKKDFVQELEAIVIHWTRQIKETVNSHDNAYHAEVSGPLEEIEFWRSRTVDLSGIAAQLKREDVRKVVQVLKFSKSSYLARFETLVKKITENSIEANDNLKFLQHLIEPCEKLSNAKPAEICAALPELLNSIRMIWTLSGYYNHKYPERLTGLLRKISNEIIRRCCQEIDVSEVLDGDVRKSTKALEESIKCGVLWKRMYRKTQAAIKLGPPPHWCLDDASVFAQIDAFVQRCRDLIEICEGQIQFCRKLPSGECGPIPPIPELGKALLEIQDQFLLQIDRLRSLDYDVLDVKFSSWHDDYNVFKNAVKDLEVMYQNVMNSAFDGVTRVSEAVAILEIFHGLAKRDAIVRCVEKKTVDCFNLFQKTVEDVRHDFDENRRNPPLRQNEPRWAGAALWAKSLMRVVQDAWGLLEKATYLTKTREADEAKHAYTQLLGVLNDYKASRYKGWVDSLEAVDGSTLQQKLENPLMKRSGLILKKDNLLECNFDHSLLSMFAEVQYWEKFQGEFSIPYVAHDVCNQREKLRVMREHVMLVVRSYNAIICDLSVEERRLFADHIRKLDKRINQGLSKLNWATKGVVEHYVRDCCIHCGEVSAVVKKFKNSKLNIAKECKSLMSVSILRVDKNVIYDEGAFESLQSEHRKLVKKQFQSGHESINAELKAIGACFPPEVQREWRELVKRCDSDLESALRFSVKKSLQELSRSINGDAKTEPQNLFGVKIVLESGRVDYRPTMINLTHVVNIVAKELISTVAVVPRLQENIPSFYSKISNDEDMLKIVVQIMNGMSSTATELQKYLGYWEKYKPIWEMDKEAYIRRYAKANRTLKNFTDDVQKYKDLQAEIQLENSTHLIAFVQLDCAVLKSSLIGHCQLWQQKLLGLLNSNGKRDLDFLHDSWDQLTVELTTAPSNLEELSSKIELLQEEYEKLPEVELKLSPVEDIYGVLFKFEVQIASEEQKRLTNLHQKWAEFKEMLDFSQKLLDTSKVTMRRELETSLQGYDQQVKSLREHLLASLPIEASTSYEEAQSVIEEYKQKVQMMTQKRQGYQSGLDIFSIEKPEHEEMKDTERDLKFAEEIWGLSDGWRRHFDNWKLDSFSELDLDDMERVAGSFNKQVGKLGRDIKRWGIWDQTKQKVTEFLQTLPLIRDLKNPALRERHWAELRQELGVSFDETAPDFTLDTIFATGLNLIPDLISELSSNANKELAIEDNLADIERRWASVELDIAVYKEYHKIKSTDDLFQVLEDDAVALSTMKASKFYHSFQPKIDRWEDLLGLISEVVETLLIVQRKWLYLESIFTASEDILKQLPQEARLFQDVHGTFTDRMRNAFHDPIAVNLCTPEALETATQMDDKLERIQKSLDQYLENKRQIFPRFYFVSDDDLLEILGMSKTPASVNKHVKKLFEGFKHMDLIEPGKQLNRTYECSAMRDTSSSEVAPLINSVPLDGPVENWLCDLEQAMFAAIQKLLTASLNAFKNKDKTKWVIDTLGQLVITTGSIQWTQDCSKALAAIQSGQKQAMRQSKKKQVAYVAKLTEMIRGNIPKLVRKKLVALITMELHNRDVIERLLKANCQSINDFEWLSQLRFVFNKDDEKCQVRQTNVVLDYGYEYQGNNGRLVVTPLTDRCILTLLTAKFLNRGGNPLGPAGTGKTETVKDLGKNLAVYVVVINCSDGMDYKSCGRIFSGLCQSGAWGCFDEFNRIKIEVISVVAMQVLSIVDALSRKADNFSFMGQQIKCNPQAGVFITMNPGYAGRTELPDNLKALMRPVAMMVPDLAMIAEVMLSAEGFTEARILAKKTVTLYSLMQQQLSKQDFYDYGLRNLKAVLTMAGSLKRQDPSGQLSEETILMRALRDMNLPKFIKDDERLFRLLLGDLFPGLELPVSENEVLSKALREELHKAKLQSHDFLLYKMGQLHDSKQTRHCNMLVGAPLAGKSTAWKTLAKAKTSLSKAGEEGFYPVQWSVINAKSITLTELYGAYDVQTFEWADGILSTLFKECAESEKQVENWIVFDGPVDAMWIESMNSVMDDNKILTLINGDRIPLTSLMSLVFEVEDLRVASPATVSRAGMIFVDSSEIGYKPYLESWLERTFAGSSKDQKESHRTLFDKYVPALLAEKRKIFEPVPTQEFNSIQSLLSLYESYYEANCSELKDEEAYQATIDKWFQFCVVWSIGCAADEDGRRALDVCLREKTDSNFPPNGLVYDYFVDPKKTEFESWESTLTSWRPRKGDSFFQMLVPTVDTLRHEYVFGTVVSKKRHLLVVGDSGVGKTVGVESLLRNQDQEKFSVLTVNFSATTKSSTLQEIIEGVMEKRSKDKLGPSGGKQLIVFADDFNMPQKCSAESPFQPPLELLRLFIDYGGWYDRFKCAWRHILDTQLVAVMAPPSGGRSEICSRTQARFHLVNCTTPADSQLIRIFESILAPKLQEFDNEIKPMARGLAVATLGVYKEVLEKFLPTPEKSLYQFNLRDASKVIQGTLQAERHNFDTQHSMLRLWCHECQRVFADRFLTDGADDRGEFRSIIEAKMKDSFDSADWDTVMMDCEDKSEGPLVCGLLNPDENGEKLNYEEVQDSVKLQRRCEDVLEDYNLEPKLVSMRLVLFKDAVRHICRIHRVLSMPRGNLMLVGVGGSGRQSLARLAAYAANCEVFSIEITKNYRLIEWHDDMKRLFDTAGVENRSTVFLFSDTQLKDDLFLEEINSVLTSGLIPNLYGKDELPAIYDGVRKRALDLGYDDTASDLWKCFVDSVRNNLHIVLCVSPVGAGLRTRCRYYPGLINATTIDRFERWPADALKAVGDSFLAEIKSLEEPEAISEAFSRMHLMAQASSDTMLAELKRHNYITPTHFLELASTYSTLLKEKSLEIGSAKDKLANGLAKLIEARAGVEVMSVELAKKKVVCAQSQKDCESLLVEIVSERRVADEQRKQVETDSERIAKEEVECKTIAADAEADLAVAMPALEKAMLEVDKLDKGAISEVKAYKAPPKPVETVLAAVMILFGKATDWATAKKVLGESNFLQSIKTFDKDNVPGPVMKKIKGYVAAADFTPEAIGAVSRAAGALCTWVHAIYIYANVAKDVAPKRAALKTAQESLGQKQTALAKAQEELAEVTAKVQALKERYDSSVGEKNRLKAEADQMQLLLDRADKLVSGLAGENERWQVSIKVYETDLIKIVGDSLVSAAFLSYAGPFDTRYRARLVENWTTTVNELKIPLSENFSFATYCSKPVEVREWRIAGLPADDFSTENGCVAFRSSRFPLAIDPQGQAKKWLTKTYKEKNLIITDPGDGNLLRNVERGVQFGLPVLLQDVGESIDPALDPVLSRATLKIGNRLVLKLGDKELDWSPEFRLLLTTRLAAPHYPPEVSTKTCIINFSVVQEGLEAQLLGTIVATEVPALEAQNAQLTIRVAAGKKKLVDLEDEILRLLSETKGSLLDSADLVDTLQNSKQTSDEVTRQLKEAEDTAAIIHAKREEFRPAAVRSSIAYFVLADMGRVDPMYAFSLDSYVDLLMQSMDSSKGSLKNQQLSGLERSKQINAYHTYATYKYTCRGLFERHKLLFSVQLCLRILASENKVPKKHFDFLCHGSAHEENDRKNPCSPWLDQASWDNLIALDSQLNLTGLATSFEQNKEWKAWFSCAKPEETPLPGDWDTKLTELERVCLVRAVRLDRVLMAMTRFVSSSMGPQFADPPPFDLRAVYETSTPKTPLIFILSPGVDPTQQVAGLAASLDSTLDVCALGQGQAPVAVGHIDACLKRGGWCLLANCHLMLSWLPELEKRIEEYCSGDVRDDYRLWLSASPSPQFPIAILQRGVKMTTEPPRGLRANMLQLYNLITEDQYTKCAQKSTYRRLLFALAWFHSVLLERRKFRNLGFNVPYEFNNSDFGICHDLLIVLLDEYPEKVPLDALRYLIAEANYGGRVTDSLDRRLVNCYITQFFCEESASVDSFNLAPLITEKSPYQIPGDVDLDSAKEAVKNFPQNDSARAFGQHVNAEISSQIEDSNNLLSTIISLQPKTVVEGAETTEEKVAKSVEIISEQIPEVFDAQKIRIDFQSRPDPDPLKTVLFQEIDRYNLLLTTLHKTLTQLDLAVKGQIVVTSELEEMIESVLEMKVPKAWSFCYPSLKPIFSWVKDLVLRIEAMSFWIDDSLPKCFWLPSFTYPTGFLTALLQTSARKNQVPIDTLTWDFPVVNTLHSAISQHAKEGAYVHGLFLEGARFDADKECLVEPVPMELVVDFPVLHLKPVDSKTHKKPPDIYACPLFMYAIRTGSRERPSFVVSVDLNCGTAEGGGGPDYWTARGTALLLSTAS